MPHQVKHLSPCTARDGSYSFRNPSPAPPPRKPPPTKAESRTGEPYTVTALEGSSVSSEVVWNQGGADKTRIMYIELKNSRTAK